MENLVKKKSFIFVSIKDEAANEKGNLYTPALKLIEKAAKDKEKEAADALAVAALAEQERIRKRNEEKRKSNLEIFKEELKRFSLKFSAN